MDTIISILFLIILFFIIYLFARILFPVLVFFLFVYIIYAYLIKPFMGPKTSSRQRTRPTNDYRSPQEGSSSSRPSSNPDVFDAEFETRDIHDE